MFGIGISELLVILCLIIVFVRPRDLPKLFRRLGRMYAQAKDFYDQIAATRDDLINEIEMDTVSEQVPGRAEMDEAFRPYARPMEDGPSGTRRTGRSEEK